jgi:hypothetical protein
MMMEVLDQERKNKRKQFLFYAQGMVKLKQTRIFQEQSFPVSYPGL